MKLADVLLGQPYRCLQGATETVVTSLAHDSRRAGPGAAFFCLPGHHFDGRQFALDAVGRGAVAVVAQNPLPSLPPFVTVVAVPDTRRSFALSASTFWGNPGAKLRLFAVTGTNGKTTVNHLVEAILRADGRPAGLIGTVENHLGARNVLSDLTTPDAQDIQAGLAAMVGTGLGYGCVEASSHGLAGHRLDGCAFDVAALTNVARDHLEFHVDVREYAATKLRLFRGLGQVMGTGDGYYRARAIPKAGPVYAVLNADDAFFDAFRTGLPAPYLAYAVVGAAHVKLAAAVLGPTGSRVRVAFSRRPRGLPAADWLVPASDWPDDAIVDFPHPGRHNVANLLTALSVAWGEGCRFTAARRAAETFHGVRGRWEIVRSRNGVTGVVDFAHNPGGLARALETARLVARRRVILVFGCEGQKDRGKRSVMGAIAIRLADHVILTQDNTFHENGRQILGDIEVGLRGDILAGDIKLVDPAHWGTYEVVEDRREAIFRAVELAGSGDLVVVAGRGHDAKLVFGSRVEILDDRQILEQALAAAHAARNYSHSMVEGGLEVTS